MVGQIISAASIIESRKRELRGAAKYKFPSDLGPHSMLINFSDFKYDPTNTTVSNIVSTSSIVLPIPTSLEDNINIQAQNADLGIMGAALLQVAKTVGGGKASGAQLATDARNLVSGMFSSGGPHDNDDAQSIGSSYQAFAKFLGRNALDQLPGASLALNVYNGTAVNPHTTLDFNGVTLKSHTFTWTLSPKSSAESDTLRNIITMLKRNALPAYKAISGELGPRALLKYPKLINVSLLGVDQSHFTRYKPGMVQNVSVRYSQGDHVSFFAGGKPTTVGLTLQFIEASIHTAEDY